MKQFLLKNRDTIFYSSLVSILLFIVIVIVIDNSNAFSGIRIEFILIFQLLILLLAVWSFVANKPEKLMLADEFLQLNSKDRKRGLDLAWELGSRDVTKVSFFTSFLNVLNQLFLFLISANVLYMWIVAYVHGINVVDVKSLIALLILTALIVLSLKLLSKIKESICHQKSSKNYDNKLKALCVKYINQNCELWLSEVELRISELSKQEIQSIPEREFVLVSYTPSHTAVDMPPTKIEFTNLYSNGFVTSVTNILFNLKDTTYTLVNSDLPTYNINESKFWGMQEYHYKDVTEVNYESAEVSNSSVVSQQVEYRSEGYLTLSLNNSTKKSYPATKSRSSEFIQYVRNKVRESKLKGS